MLEKFIVRLTEPERASLEELVSKGKAAAYKIKHANVLLRVDADGPNWTDAHAAEAASCTPRTVFNIRQRCVEQGLEAALARPKRDRPPRQSILDGAKEARLVQLACSEPPPGQARWTLKLLAEQLVALEVVESISAPTLMRALKKRTQAPPEKVLGDSTGAKRRVCCRDGGCAGGLSASL